MTTAKANPNFHVGTKTTVFDVKADDKRFIEYRKRWYEYPKKHIIGDFPIHLDIESTYRCNLKCPFCARTFNNWGGPTEKDLDFSLYKKIVDEGSKNNLYSIKLSLRGEPLLHRKISEMVSYAKEKKIIDVYFNTNAVLLNEKIIYKLINARLDRISISFEGIDKEEYEKNRPPAKFENVLKNVKLLRSIKDSLNVKHPQIRVQTVLTPTMKKIFPKYVDFWKNFADEVSYLDMRKETPGYNHQGTIAKWCCPFPWQRMVVLCDWTIIPCLLHGIGDFSKFTIGNAKNIDIKEAWLGEKMDRFRELNKSGQGHLLEACDQCSFRAMELEKNGIVKK